MSPKKGKAKASAAAAAASAAATTTESSNPKFSTIKIKTRDSKIVQIDLESITKQSGWFVKYVDEKGGPGGAESASESQPIFLNDVDKKTLDLVMEWANHHKEDEPEDHYDIAQIPRSQRPKYFKGWDKHFINRMENEQLRNLILAAHVLEIKKLESLGLYKKALLIRGKTVEEMREILGVEDDLTDEIKEKLRIEKRLFE